MRFRRLLLSVNLGRAMTQAVSRWLPTAEALIRVRQYVGSVLEKSALGQVFFKVSRFPLQSSFH
jgi:hypothetical protein